jgi:hypothetical protein
MGSFRLTSRALSSQVPSLLRDMNGNLYVNIIVYKLALQMIRKKYKAILEISKSK